MILNWREPPKTTFLIKNGYQRTLERERERGQKQNFFLPVHSRDGESPRTGLASGLLLPAYGHRFLGWFKTFYLKNPKKLPKNIIKFGGK